MKLDIHNLWQSRVLKLWNKAWKLKESRGPNPSWVKSRFDAYLIMIYISWPVDLIDLRPLSCVSILKSYKEFMGFIMSTLCRWWEGLGLPFQFSLHLFITSLLGSYLPFSRHYHCFRSHLLPKQRHFLLCFPWVLSCLSQQDLLISA